MTAPTDVTETCQQARRVLTLIERPTTARVPSERQVHVLAAMAATARCRALLRSIVHLVEVGRADTIGVEVRALLEMWYFGVVTLLGDQDDLSRLEADYRYWTNNLAKKMGQPEDDEPAAVFKVRDRAQRADALLESIGEQSGNAVALYDQVFSGESLLNAHASFQSVDRYAFEDDGVVGIVLEPEVDARDVCKQVRMAAVLTALLAKWTYDRAGLDSSAYDDIDGLWDV